MSNEERDAAREDMKNQEVKKVNKADIYALGLEKGRIIADSAQKLLKSHLTSAIQDSGLAYALSYCHTNAYALMDSVAEEGIVVRRVSTRFRNPADAPDELEAVLLDSYAYSAENNEAMEDNIQEYDDEFLIYTRPIVAASPMCLQCHGEQVAPALRDTLSKLYPHDKALNHQLNDLRGMWSIKLPVSEIVKGLD